MILKAKFNVELLSGFISCIIKLYQYIERKNFKATGTSLIKFDPLSY